MKSILFVYIGYCVGCYYGDRGYKALPWLHWKLDREGKSKIEDWIQLNFNQNFNSRLTKFITTDTSRYKIGKNRMSNRLRVINNEIELSDLNKSYNAFKMLMKKLYLSGTPIT